MRTDLFFAMMAAAGFGPERHATIRVVDNPQFTKEVMVKHAQIAGKRLKLLSRNPHGDCLCVGETEQGGAFMVDVDVRDVAA